MLCGIEVYGFGKFEVPTYVTLSGNNYFTGRSSSGKTIFLKCIQFFLDSEDSVDAYYISCEKAYVKGYFRFEDKVYWIKKTVVSKGRSAKCEVTYDGNIPLEVYRWYEGVRPIYFNNERYYSNKENELKDAEKRAITVVKENIIDEIGAVEIKVNNLLKDISDRTGIDFEFKLDVNKGINISVKYDEYVEYLSTSERKMLLLDVLFKSSKGSFLLLDDLDLYLDVQLMDDIKERLELLGVPFVAIVRNNKDVTNGYIDYKFNQDILSLREYEDKYN